MKIIKRDKITSEALRIGYLFEAIIGEKKQKIVFYISDYFFEIWGIKDENKKEKIIEEIANLKIPVIYVSYKGKLPDTYYLSPKEFLEMEYDNVIEKLKKDLEYVLKEVNNGLIKKLKN